MRSRSDRTDHLAAWATAYVARLGWPVFPLAPRAKTPLTQNGFKDASLDYAKIDAWWTRNPDANIGAPTGHAFDVLDIDGPDGVTSLRERLGFTYHHDGPLALTGKGWHMLFAPTGSGNGAGLLPKVDFRGVGGYIVVPPSIHPLGHAYQWAPDRGPKTPLPTAPAWLTELVNRDDNPAKGLSQRVAPQQPNKAWMLLQEVVQTNTYPDQSQIPRDRRFRADRPSILEVADRRGMRLRRRAHYYQTECVFHEDSTPSLTLYPADNTFYCYGCQVRGDSYDLDQDPPRHAGMT